MVAASYSAAHSVALPPKVTVEVLVIVEEVKVIEELVELVVERVETEVVVVV